MGNTANWTVEKITDTLIKESQTQKVSDEEAAVLSCIQVH